MTFGKIIKNNKNIKLLLSSWWRIYTKDFLRFPLMLQSPQRRLLSFLLEWEHVRLLGDDKDLGSTFGPWWVLFVGRWYHIYQSWTPVFIKKINFLWYFIDTILKLKLKILLNWEFKIIWTFPLFLAPQSHQDLRWKILISIVYATQKLQM